MLTRAPRDIAGRQGALLLQGSVGLFFARLQDHLDTSGWDTIKVQFNAGDCLFQGAGRQLLFSRPLDELSAWLEALLTELGPKAIRWLGDQKPIHRIAAEVALRLGIAAASFEEGYLRPHYITVELGGNNTLSPLRNWLFEGRRMSAPALRAIDKRVLYRMAGLSSAYYAALRIGGLSFRHYEHHRRRWRLPPRLRPGWRAFRIEIIQRSQVNGSYYLTDEFGATCCWVELRAARLVCEHASTSARQLSAQMLATDELRRARSKAKGGGPLVPRPSTL